LRGRYAEGLFKPKRHVRRQRGLSIHDITQCHTADLKMFGGLADIQPVRLDNIPSQPGARMNGQGVVQLDGHQ
jgi:hypothetical protein